MYNLSSGNTLLWHICQWISRSRPRDDSVALWIAPGEARSRADSSSLSEGSCTWMTACRWEQQPSWSFPAAGDRGLFCDRPAWVFVLFTRLDTWIWSGKFERGPRGAGAVLFILTTGTGRRSWRNYVWVRKLRRFFLKIETAVILFYFHSLFSFV